MSDYSYTILIPSYDRYELLLNEVESIRMQTDSKIVIIDDGSTDDRYKTLASQIKNLELTSNEKNVGKKSFYKVVKSLITHGLTLKTDFYVFLGDDFIISDNLMEYLDDIKSPNTIINIFPNQPKKWNSLEWIDGMFLCSDSAMYRILEYIPNKDNRKQRSTGVWQVVSNRVTNDKDFHIKLTNYSLIQHIGNDENESKLHPFHRKETPIVSDNFIDDVENPELKII